MALTEKQRITAFVDVLEKNRAMALSDEELDNLRAAPDEQALQDLAISYGAPTDLVQFASKASQMEYQATTPLGQDYISRQGPSEITPEIQSDLDVATEALEEKAEEIGTAEDELLALLGGDDEVEETVYLGLGDEDPAGYTDIISAPGYTFTYGEGQVSKSTAYMRSHTEDAPTMYATGDELKKWSGYSPHMRNEFTKAMIEAGMIDEEDVGGLTTGAIGRGAFDLVPVDRGEGYTGTSRVQLNAFKEALATANYLGTTPMGAIFARGETAKAKPKGGSGSGRQAFSIPAQFRTVPDYETLQQRTKEMMRQTMGREPEDWEMNLLADEMQGQHKAYNEKMIQASREAYNRGQHTVDIEVPDPKDRTQKFFEETYSGEINRRRDIGEASATNNLMMTAMTQGTGMVA